MLLFPSGGHILLLLPNVSPSKEDFFNFQGSGKPDPAINLGKSLG